MTRAGGSGAVTGLDINPGMLGVARSLPAVAGAASIEWQEGSVLGLPFPDAAFDVVLCQLGLQFFPDRPTALGEIRRVLAPGGRTGISVFGPIEHNPATHALAGAGAASAPGRATGAGGATGAGLMAIASKSGGSACEAP